MKTYLAHITVQLWLPAVVVLMVTTYACAAAQARWTLFGPMDRISSRKAEKRIDAAIAREPRGGSRRNRKLGRLSARIKVGHCLPLSNFPISQPASPCARRSRPIDVFVLASSDREMSQLENGIRPLVRDTAALSAIALPGLCAVSEALVAVRVIKIPVRHTSWCCGRSDRFLDQR